VATKKRATIMHGHWVIPGGVIAAMAARSLPLVISLHGTDVFVAERHAMARWAARAAFRQAIRITACSDDLRVRALAMGADPARIETVPYGVDTARFAPNDRTRAEVRRDLGLGDAPVVLAAGRLVKKKGFEYAIDAAQQLAASHPGLRLLIAGDGDLMADLAGRARDAGDRVRMLGNQPQGTIARLAAAADVIAVPSIRDDAGNVDGLPNFALEALASGTPVVATTAGGLPQVIEDGTNGLLVPERDASALARAVSALLDDRGRALRIGQAARARVIRDFSWEHVAERFEAAYALARP
jgi:glycosyltransferase involved in cell wall biosynthesis